MTKKQGMFVIPPCDEAMKWTSQALDSRLSFRQRFLLKMHLRLCSSCSEYHEQVSFLHRTIEKLFARTGKALDVPFAELSLESKDRMKQHLESHNR